MRLIYLVLTKFVSCIRKLQFLGLSKPRELKLKSRVFREKLNSKCFNI